MIYGAAMLPMHYLLSHVFSGPALGFVIMFFVNVLFGKFCLKYNSSLDIQTINMSSRKNLKIKFNFNNFAGMMGSQIVQALASPQLDTKEVADIMDKVLQFFPLYSLVTSVR